MTSKYGYTKKRLCSIIAAAAALMLCSCNQTQPVKDMNAAQEGYQSVDDLYIVDCLLPGQVRSLGSMKYVAARRPVRTTAVDCGIRGGEYVAYDRADYRSALNVWLPQAEAGDAQAQNYVGEIFEKGLGQEPDYVSARQWYLKAAQQGYSRAQVNLGYLYEKGLGVAPDITLALNWYRKASGIENDELILNSEAQQQIAAVREELNTKLKKASVQTNYLQKQIAQLREDLERQTALAEEANRAVDRQELEFARQEIAALVELYEDAAQERDALQEQVGSMEIAYRQYSSGEFLAPQPSDQVASRVVEDINFGRYYALIIGNQDYIYLDDLRSPLSDAEQIKNVLEQKYGFSVLMLPNATEKNILNTINEFYEQIGEQDNLLIYYAGHGNISKRELSRTQRGYWLPIDAGKDNISNWINNSVISDHLDRIKARSVLVIADSCYAGYLGSEKSPFLFGVSGAGESKKAIQSGIKRRARVVISSGGEKPVLDGADGRHSVFATALIEALNQNDNALRDSSLFSQLSVNVRKRIAGQSLAQVPEMKPVREAGHEGGAFYFVPVN